MPKDTLNPCPSCGSVVPVITPNIDLRSWFAGMALQGQASFEGMEGCDKKQWVGMAYELADAMLKQREEQP